uniref:Translocon-associated protein subunit beta n=1 Tax=Scophthalmus maximus TaxID=52904 RepID=A0A8D3CZ05_SCOMX
MTYSYISYQTEQTQCENLARSKYARKHKYIRKEKNSCLFHTNSSDYKSHVWLSLTILVRLCSAALEVELSDDSFPPEDFGIVSGMLNVKWDRIAPASNVSHTVVLRPLKAGYFNFTSASVSYLAQEGGQVVVGFTSAPGQGGILAQREFDRRFSPHYLDWAAFGVMTLPSIGIPLLLWYSSKRKYDSPKAKKN